MRRILRQLRNGDHRQAGAHLIAFDRVVIDENQRIETDIQLVRDGFEIGRLVGPVGDEGGEIPADIIVTATGLNVQLFGGMTLTVDGQAVDLSETVAYDPELAAPAADLGLLDDDDDLPLPLPRQLDPAMQRTARLASLDPNDGIEL